MPWEMDGSVLAGLVRVFMSKGMGKKSLKSDQKAHFGQFQRHGLVLVDCILLAIHRHSTEMPPKQRNGECYEST
jgi:hypothetical protein